MKNGFFHFGAIISFCVAICVLTLLSGCATFLELDSGETQADFDHGYVEEEEESDDTADANSREEARPTRALASKGGKRVKHAIQAKDVILGMTRQDVLSSWGEPNQRAVAGSGNSGHERWTYGSRYNLSGSRTIIFEDGKVAGWHR